MKGNKVPQSPEDFEYIMWENEGKFFVRVKGQQEAVEVNDKVKKYLRSLEKSIRRENRIALDNPVDYGLNLDLLLDNLMFQNPEIYVLRKLEWEEIVSKLTDNQYTVFIECFVRGLTYRECSENIGETVRFASYHAQEVKRKIFTLMFDKDDSSFGS